ncbi:GntR family transcriptional regulator [Mycetocola spongiae]|uniref:GntR family transcriptional regulator n=1 Tax=Mycetocola spongiae TaxID=2859226 RepID=UPI001CF5E84A|nr:GntR family transcriptional regulator [Mycetocola spongiae]
MSPDSFEFDRSLPAPLHVQVSEEMRARIASGRWQPHYRLKAEPDLAVDLGISRGTLRRAISTLVDEGVLVHTRGRGTFVTSATIEPAIAQSLRSLAEDFAAQGIPWHTRVIGAEVIDPPTNAASLLDSPTDSRVFRLTRQGLTGDAPVAYLVNYVRLDLAPGIQDTDFAHSTLFGALEGEFGLRIGSGRRTFAAVAAPAEVSESLGLPAHIPMQHLEQITYLVDGTPVEFSEVWINSAKLRVSSLLSRG